MRTTYYVVLKENTWFIKLNEKHYGPYQTQQSAIDAAVNACKINASKNLESNVVIQGKDNKFRDERTFLNDPFPPRDK